MKFVMKYILFLALSVLVGCTDDNPIFAGASDNTSTQLTIVPLQTSINKATTQQYEAYLVSQDGSQRNITEASTWSIDQEALASINQRGRLSALNAGELRVSAEYQGMLATANLIITDKTIAQFSVLPGEAVTLVGLTRQFSSFVEFTDGSNQEVTLDTQWTSSDTQIATFADNTGRAEALTAGLVTVSAEFSSFTGIANLEVIDGEPTEFLITPPVSYLPIGVNENFTASITLATDPIEYLDVTEQVVWSIDDPSLASISNEIGLQGQATAISEGLAIVTASLSFAGQSTTANAELNIIPIRLESIQVNPKSVIVVRGTEGQYTATGIFNDQQTRDITDTVVWTSSNEAVAKISTFGANSGLAVAITPGTTDITAALSGLSDTVSGTVVAPELDSLRVYPETTSIPLGASQPFVALAYFKDGTSQDVSNRVNWLSSNSALASFNPRIAGQADTNPTYTGALPDTIDISASLDDISSNTALLTVTTATPIALQIAPGDGNLPIRVDANYLAFLEYSNQTSINVTDQVNWSSSAGNIASISNAPGSEGRTHTLQSGISTIAAAYDDGTVELDDSVSLLVTSSFVSFIRPQCSPTELPVGDLTTCSCIAVLSDNGEFDCTAFATYKPTLGGVLLFGTASTNRNIGEAIASGGTNVLIKFNNASGNATVKVDE
jgi:hypothetical protein